MSLARTAEGRSRRELRGPLQESVTELGTVCAS